MLKEAAEDKKLCLEEVNGRHQLSKEHQYYSQVQAKIFISGRSYCDFVVWTKADVDIEQYTVL